MWVHNLVDERSLYPIICILSVAQILLILANTSEMAVDQTRRHETHLLIAVPPNYLYHNWAETKNGTTGYYGLAFDILRSLSSAFNFTYNVLPAQNYGLGQDGLTGMLYNKNANMSIGAISTTYERYKFVDFLMPYQYIDTTFATYQASPQPDIFLSVQPLRPITVLIIAATWAVASFVLCLCSARSDPSASKWCLMLDVTYNMFGVGFRQSVQGMNSSSTLVRTIFASWSFIILIFTTVYVSTLVALAAVPPKAKTMDSFDQLAASPDYTAMIYDGSSVKEAFQTSKRGALAAIWKNQINPYPENLVPFTKTQDYKLKRLSSDKVAFVSNHEELGMLHSLECHLHIARDRAYSSGVAFAITKDAPFKERFDKHILALLQGGIISERVSSYEKKFFNTTGCQKAQQTASPIIVANVVGLLLTLAVGLFCCCIVLGIEYFAARQIGRKKKATFQTH